MLSEPLSYLEQKLAPVRQRLLDHDLYTRLQTLSDLRRFMEAHVFAVWDFMSLLKALQRNLTCVQVPWVPTAAPTVRRFINEIVLEEESDVDAYGQPTSHFELYVQAMKECGADTGPIETFLAALAAGQSVRQALGAAAVPAPVRHFVETTFDIINSGKTCAISAAFTFGREDLIPSMFRSLVAELQANFPGQLDTFVYYLDRHIQLDEDTHAPLARQMVRALCADDPHCWLGCQEVAIRCIEARIELWDSIKTEQQNELLTVPISVQEQPGKAVWVS